MKKTSSPSHCRIWTADTVSLPAVRVGGVQKPLCLMFTMDQKTGMITSYAFFSRPSSLSLIRLLNIAFHDYVPPDLIVADFTPGFEFDAWGPAGHLRCKVVSYSPNASARGAMEKVAQRFRRFLHLHFGKEPPVYAALLLMTDVFFDDFNKSSASGTEVSE